MKNFLFIALVAFGFALNPVTSLAQDDVPTQTTFNLTALQDHLADVNAVTAETVVNDQKSNFCDYAFTNVCTSDTKTKAADNDLFDAPELLKLSLCWHTGSFLNSFYLEKDYTAYTTLAETPPNQSASVLSPYLIRVN